MNNPPGDNRPPVYWEEGSDGQDNLIIRASALGTSCLWELTAAGQGHEPGTLPASLVRAFAEGHELEPVVISMLEARGFKFLSHQEERMLYIAPGLYVRYHPDGIADYDTQNWVVEVKALSDALWSIFASRGMENVIDEYPWQLSVMMEDQQLPGMWAGFNKDTGALHLQPVMTPPIPLAQLKAKALAIKEAVTGEDIVEAGKSCDSPGHWPCRYQHLRPEGNTVDGEEAKDTLLVEGERANEINRMVRQYIYSKGQADEATATANRNRDSLLELGEGFDQIETDTWIIPIYGSTTRYLDEQAMRDDGIDVEKYRKTKPKSRWLNKRNIKRKVTDDNTGTI